MSSRTFFIAKITRGHAKTFAQRGKEGGQKILDFFPAKKFWVVGGSLQDRRGEFFDENFAIVRVK